MRSSSSSAGILCGASFLLAQACGTVAVRVPVMRPAEVNMAAYPSVAVGELRTRDASRALSDGLEEALVASHRFQVVDRAHLSQTMREQRLSASDFGDPANAARLGKLVAASALIYGDVDERYRENPDETPYKDQAGHQHVSRSVMGEALVHVTFKVVDASTGQLLVARTYEDKKSEVSRAEDARPAPIAREQLFQRARQTVIDRFLRAIVPYQEYVYARFEKDSDLPQLEGGVGSAERGDWDRAKEIFGAVAAAAGRNPKLSGKQLGKAYWDLGLAYEYNGEYEAASKMVQKAYDASREKDYLPELDAIEQLRADARRLAEQSAQPMPVGAQ